MRPLATQRIESLDDSRIEDYRDIKDAELRRARGLFIAEGRGGVRCLLEQSRFRARSVFVTPAALEGLRDSLERTTGSLPVFVGSQQVMNGVVGFDLHRGALAAGERSDELSFEDLVQPGAHPSRLLMLEKVSDPANIGAIFRNAAAFGADGVLLCPSCCDPLYRRAVRVSMGGVLRVPYARCPVWPGVLHAVRAVGYRTIALHPGPNSIELSDVSIAAQPDRLALVFGAEGAGLSREVLEAVDLRVRIPMAPGIDSINVGTASGIALHHLLRRARPARVRSD